MRGLVSPALPAELLHLVLESLPEVLVVLDHPEHVLLVDMLVVHFQKQELGILVPPDLRVDELDLVHSDNRFPPDHVYSIPDHDFQLVRSLTLNFPKHPISLSIHNLMSFRDKRQSLKTKPGCHSAIGHIGVLDQPELLLQAIDSVAKVGDFVA